MSLMCVSLYIVIILSDNCRQSHCVTVPLSVCGWLAQGPMLTHWHTQTPVRRSEPSMSFLLILAFCQ